MLNPKSLDKIVNTAVQLKLVSSYLSDFVNRELGKPENRKRVYISWNHFKPLGYTHKQLKQAFRKSKFEKRLILGEKDIVIPPNKILPILGKSGFETTILPLKHHQLIKPEVAKLL